MKTNYLHFILSLLIILWINPSKAQNGPAEKWSFNVGGSEDEIASNVLPTSDGGYILTGYSKSNDIDVTNNHGWFDAWIVKRKSDGTQEWQMCYGTFNGKNNDEYSRQSIEVNDGYIIVGTKNANIWIYKISKNGSSIIWEKYFSLQSEGLSIRGKADGSFLVGGRVIAGPARAILIHYNAAGEVIRDKQSDFVSTNWGDDIKEIKLSSDGKIVIMGNRFVKEETCGGELSGDVWIAKLENSFDILWSKTIGGSSYDYFLDGDVTSNNDYYILGRTYCKGFITGPNNIGKDWLFNYKPHFAWLAKLNNLGNLTKVIIVTGDSRIADLGDDYYSLCISCEDFPVLGGSFYGYGGNLGVFYPRITKWMKDLSKSIWNSELLAGDPKFLYDINVTNDNCYIAAGEYECLTCNDKNYLILKTEKDPDCAGSANKCSNITPISCGQTYIGTTIGRASNFKITDLNSCYISTSPFDAGDQIFEVYKPNSNGDLVITLFCDNLDLDVFLLTSCNPIQCIASSTQPKGTKYNQDILRINNASAGYYYILVDGSTKTDVGPFQLTVNCGLLDCNNATPMQCKQTLINESNANGFNNISLYCNPTQIGSGTGCTGREKVYTFTLKSTQNVTISLSNIRNPLNDFELYLFKDCNEDICIAKSTNAPGVNETITTSLSPGSYYIVVEGWRESQGNYDLSVDWNCCNNPVEVYNCGFVSHNYSGNGNNLQYTFTSTKAIAVGKKWKLGSNEISTATSTTFTYTFPSEGEYVICFPYLNANGCLEYCCYRVWISNPFNCFDWDYKFDPSTNNFIFNLNQPNASNISWIDDTGGAGGNIGNGPISNPLPVPTTGCVEKTITVKYFLNQRWYNCCRKIWLCNPFECLQFDYKYDANSDGFVFNLDDPGASNITWIDDTGGGGGNIGGGSKSNPVPILPSSGGCVEKIITAKYFYNNRWYVCCRRIWLCNPFECLQFDYKYDANSNGFVFNLDDPGASNITWIDDTGGGGGNIGGGSKSNPVPIPPSSGGCVEKIITAKYFYNSRWYVCCRRVWLCNPFECLQFDYKYDANSNGFVFNLDDPGASNITWIDDTGGGGGNIGGGSKSNPVPIPSSSGGCVEKIITAKYFYNNRWYMCCRRVWLCNPFECLQFDYKYDANSNGFVFNLDDPGASNITWIDDTGGGGGPIGSGNKSNPIPVPLNSGACVEKVITAKYFYNNRWYVCCRRVWLCNPFECVQFDYKYNASSNAYVFNLDDPGASNITWIDDTGGGGGSIGSGNKSNPIPVPPNSGGCVEKIITAKYFYNNRWYVCSRRVWLCNPYFCSSEINSKSLGNGDTELSTNVNYQEIKWIDNKTGQELGRGNNLIVIFALGSNQEICLYYKSAGINYICCKQIVITKSNNFDKNKNEFLIFPNPFQSLLYIQFGSNIDKKKLIIRDVLGNIIQTIFWEESTIEINTLTWVPGIYFYELIDIKSQNKYSGKVVKH